MASSLVSWPRAVVSIVLISCGTAVVITLTALGLYHRRLMAGLPPVDLSRLRRTIPAEKSP